MRSLHFFLSLRQLIPKLSLAVSGLWAVARGIWFVSHFLHLVRVKKPITARLGAKRDFKVLDLRLRQLWQFDWPSGSTLVKSFSKCYAWFLQLMAIVQHLSNCVSKGLAIAIVENTEKQWPILRDFRPWSPDCVNPNSITKSGTLARVTQATTTLRPIFLMRISIQWNILSRAGQSLGWSS